MRKLTNLQHSIVYGPVSKMQNISRISKYGILITLTLLTIAITLAIGRMPQKLTYHQFADQKIVWGVPNFFDVFTNLPFIVIGVLGMSKLPKSSAAGIHFLNYLVLFTGIFLTGFGSVFYHLHPDNATLVFDRIPMAIIFMAFLSITIAECVGQQTAKILLLPLIIFGISSVLWWYYSENQGSGDLRMYGFVQFYTIYIIPVIAFYFPSGLFKKGIHSLLWVNVTYAIAKISEQFDKEIFTITHVISGHSLKHIAATFSTWFLVKMFQEKFSR
jgi:hypothetical protein